MYVDPFWLGFLVGILFTIGCFVALGAFTNRRKK